MRQVRFHHPSFARPEVGTLRGEVIIAQGKEFSLDKVRLLAPCTPTKIICLGRNYAEHAKELGNEVPERPLLFFKPPSAVIGPGEEILLPRSSRVDHEAELAVVIGRR